MNLNQEVLDQRRRLALVEQRREIIRFVNRHTGTPMLLRTTKRSTGRPRIFLFSHLTGSLHDAVSKGLIPVWDMDKEAPRHVNLDQCEYVKTADGRHALTFTSDEIRHATDNV